MATTNIELDIENITGVADADDQFIKTAQKFVVSSIPKDLMLWAGTSTAVGSHGGDSSPTAITLPQPTDSIIDVVRNGFSAEQVPESMQGFIANSSSLHLATETFPKYYIQAGNKVIVKPDPSDSETALVNYVDFLKVDDDCDLRGAVVFYASANEFSKLSTAELPTISIAAVPPDVPSLATVSFTESSALSISATSPTAISLTSVTFTSLDSDLDASAPTFTTATVAVGGVYGSSTAPAYTKPGHPSQVAFADYWTLADFGDSDPGDLTISAVAPSISISAPGVATTAIADITTNVPTYTPPVMSAPDFSDANTWINTEEDSEMLSSRMQVINGQIAEFSTKLQDSLNEFNEDNAKYQASVQAEVQLKQHLSAENQQEASQTLEAAVQDASLQVQKYQAIVNDEVQEYSQKLARYQLELNTVFQAWQKTESDNISVFQADIQNELNEFNKENVSFQANMQESIQEIQVANQVNIASGQASLQVAIDNENRSQQRQLQNGLNDMQAIVADNERKISQYQAEASHYATEVNQYIQNYTSRLQKDIQDTQATIANNDDLVAKYQSELQQYTSEVQAETAEYQNKIQKQQAYSKEADKYYQWAKLEVTTYIQNNSKMIAATMASRSQSAQA